MTTFATLKSRIADDLRRSDLDGQIASAVLDAVKRWEGERFWFNEKRFRIDTVDGTEEYSVPSTLLNTDGTAIAPGENISEIDDVVILDGSESYRLKERSNTFFGDYQAPASQYTGTPCFYGIYANKIRFGPVPDGVYQVTVSGLAKLVPLSADDDSNAWTDDAEPLIRHQALAEIYRVVTRDAEGFQLASGGISDALDQLRRKTSGKINVGRIRPWGNT